MEAAERTVPFEHRFPLSVGATPGPLYLYGGHPSFGSSRIAGRPPVLLNTIPKSGTYMYARLLERLGAINTDVHLSTSEFWDFRGAKVADVIAAPDDFKSGVPIEATAGLLQEGQFAVGHIDHTDHTEAALCGLVHLFCVRDIRDVLVSHMRFLLDPRRQTRPNGTWWKALCRSELFAGYLRGPGGAYFKNRILPIAGWIESSGPAVTLHFETIMGDRGREAQASCVEAICTATRVTPTVDPFATLVEDVIGSETRTYSGARSAYSSYRDDEVSALMESLGVSALNRKLGY